MYSSASKLSLSMCNRNSASCSLLLTIGDELEKNFAIIVWDCFALNKRFIIESTAAVLM